jgi:hypothetical protein
MNVYFRKLYYDGGENGKSLEIEFLPGFNLWCYSGNKEIEIQVRIKWLFWELLFGYERKLKK